MKTVAHKTDCNLIVEYGGECDCRLIFDEVDKMKGKLQHADACVASLFAKVEELKAELEVEKNYAKAERAQANEWLANLHDMEKRAKQAEDRIFDAECRTSRAEASLHSVDTTPLSEWAQTLAAAQETIKGLSAINEEQRARIKELEALDLEWHWRDQERFCDEEEAFKSFPDRAPYEYA
jgi:chromosome segregation ATPase